VGTLDLVPDGPYAEEHLTMVPCVWQEWDVHDLTNAGTIDGVLEVYLEVTGDTEGAITEPEEEVDTTTAGPDDQGELGDLLDVIVLYCWDTDTYPVLSVVQGAADFDAAAGLLADAYGDDILPHIKYGGKMNSLAGHWLTLDGNMIAGEGSRLTVLVHAEQLDGIQANVIQGDIVEVDKTLKLTQGPCDGPGGGEKVLNLPWDPVSMKVGLNTTSYMWMDIVGVPPGTWNVWDGRWDAWCVSKFRYIYTGRWYHNCYFVSSLDPCIYSYSTGWSPPLFNQLNYLINNYTEGPDIKEYAGKMQWAIWILVGDATIGQVPAAHQATVQAIVDDCINNGSSFVPAAGEWAMVLVTDNSKVQLLCIEVDP
jgi:hypothetical protein